MIKHSLAISVLLIASFLFSSLAIGAQENTSDWSRLNSVQVGTKVVVKLKTDKTVTGMFRGLSDNNLTIEVKRSNQEIRRDEIAAVYEVSKKGSATKATLIGLGVGAGAGVAVGTAAGSNDSGFDKIDHAATAALTILGAAGGALVGYLVGRGSSKRVLVYQSK